MERRISDRSKGASRVRVGDLRCAILVPENGGRPQPYPRRRWSRSLTHRIGRWRTLYLALSGAELDLYTALTWRLVDEVTRTDQSA